MRITRARAVLGLVAFCAFMGLGTGLGFISQSVSFIAMCVVIVLIRTRARWISY